MAKYFLNAEYITEVKPLATYAMWCDTCALRYLNLLATAQIF